MSENPLFSVFLNEEIRGIWKDLEEYVRSWAISHSELFVFTGPICYGGVEKTVGAGRVAVPSHIYKIIFDPQRREVIAFGMPNAALNPNDMPVYIVSIRDIEAWTGLNFLSELDQGTQDAVETMKADKLW
jgi:endonuclease G, mitochondrial